MIKTVIMIRRKQGRIHKTTLTKDVHLHLEIVEMVHERMLKRGFVVDIDELIGSMKIYNNEKEMVRYCK